MATTSTTSTTYLRRYTDLPALLHLLTEQKLTLFDPKTWDDKNDAFYISLYKEKKKLKTVLGWTVLDRLMCSRSRRQIGEMPCTKARYWLTNDWSAESAGWGCTNSCGKRAVGL